MPSSATQDRYHRIAIILHWLMALLIAANLAIGWAMTTDGLLALSNKFTAYQLHKSLGLTVLVLTGLRIFWRLTHTPPALPKIISKSQRFAAHAVHLSLYALMLGLPLTGWLMVSASSLPVPTLWFDLFEWPDLPTGWYSSDKLLKSDASSAHELMVWCLVGALVLHVGAAVFHQFILKDNTLTRMLPKRTR